MLAHYKDHPLFGRAYINKHDYIAHMENRNYFCSYSLHHHNHFTSLC